MLKNFFIGSVALACFFIGCGTDTSAVFLEPGENLEGGSDGSGGESSSGGQGGVQEVVPCSGECQLDNAFAACLNDECVIQECLSGFSDCNGLPGDGCEANTSSDPLSCGSCTNQCFVENATEACLGGSCGCLLDAGSKCVCDAGFRDCDFSRENGCESDLTSDTSCGACGINCTNKSKCLQGSCKCQALDVTGLTPTCQTCLQSNCCAEMIACEADSVCEQKYNDWRLNCSNNSSCLWSCPGGNAAFQALRDCKLNNGCNGATNGCGNNNDNCE